MTMIQLVMMRMLISMAHETQHQSLKQLGGLNLLKNLQGHNLQWTKKLSNE